MSSLVRTLSPAFTSRPAPSSLLTLSTFAKSSQSQIAPLLGFLPVNRLYLTRPDLTLVRMNTSTSMASVVAASTTAKLLLLSVYQNAVKAVQPGTLTRDAVQITEHGLLNIEERWNKSHHQVQLSGREVYVFGAGKAVLGMCQELVTQIDTHNATLALSTVGRTESSPSPPPNPPSRISITAGRLNVPTGTSIPSSITSLLSANNISVHPSAPTNIPDETSAENTKAILEMLRGARAKAQSRKTSQTSDQTAPPPSEPVSTPLPPLVLGFISGGGSALLALPKPGITMDQKRALILDLVRHGADILELNTVRSAISQVKHGQLAKLLLGDPTGPGCELVTFILSDIIGDPIDKIASGPTVPLSVSTTDYGLSPLSVLNKYRTILLPKPILNHLKRTESEQLLESRTLPSSHLLNVILGNNSIALNAAEAELCKAGYKVLRFGSGLTGEAKDVVRTFIDKLRSTKVNEEERRTYQGIALLGGGETTVTMTSGKNSGSSSSSSGKELGRGGRCQEMGLHFLLAALRAENGKDSGRNASEIPAGALCGLFAGTDGQDGPTPAAGVVISAGMVRKVTVSEDALQEAIAKHDSYGFFKKHHPEVLIETGPSGTNVMDIYCVLGQW